MAATFFWIFVEQTKKMEAEAPTVQVGANPNQTNGNPTPTTAPSW